MVLIRRLWVARSLNLEGLGGQLGAVERCLARHRCTSTASRAGAVEGIDEREGINADEVGPQVAWLQQWIARDRVFIADDEVLHIHRLSDGLLMFAQRLRVGLLSIHGLAAV